MKKAGEFLPQLFFYMDLPMFDLVVAKVNDEQI